MRKYIFLAVALIAPMAIYSQTAGRRTSESPAPGREGNEPFEIRQSIFFSDGSLDEYTLYEWDSSFSHKNNEAKYSASGAMIEQIEYTYNNDQVVMKTTKDFERRPKNRVEYLYNQQGQLWRESLVDNGNKVISSFEYSYDEKGNRISRLMRNRAGNRLAETTYAFDNQGKMTVSQTKDYMGKLIRSTEYQYDLQGNLVKQVVLNGDGKPTSIINAVWQGGHEVKNEKSAVDGTLQARTTNEYGGNGELVNRIIENFQSNSKQIVQYEYIFRPVRRQS